MHDCIIRENTKNQSHDNGKNKTTWYAVLVFSEGRRCQHNSEVRESTTHSKKTGSRRHVPRKQVAVSQISVIDSKSMVNVQIKIMTSTYIKKCCNCGKTQK